MDPQSLTEVDGDNLSSIPIDDKGNILALSQGIHHLLWHPIKVSGIDLDRLAELGVLNFLFNILPEIVFVVPVARIRTVAVSPTPECG